MTDSAEKMREAIKRFHRNCCYPEALDFEVDALVNELAALSASGTKSDGTTEGRGRYAEQPGSALGCAAPRNGGAPPTEAVAGIKPGPSDPIPSQPDEQEAIAREPTVEQMDRIAASKVRPYSHNSALILDGLRDETDIVQAAAHARLAMQAERRGVKP